MCVIYIFTLFSALYFQAVLTTVDYHTRATCKHCSLYFNVPPKPIFNSALYVNMAWQLVGRFRQFDETQGQTLLLSHEQSLVHPTQNGRSHRTVPRQCKSGSQWEDLFIPLG